ncbi:MAG TPA: J domain-containing protein [Caulobacteraceae bacterium]|nr:J domain-containing protein [Caulobacteraceae bacterium]
MMSMVSEARNPAAEPNAYGVLGVSPDAEHVVIRAAYRALMHKYSSPSRIGQDPGADDARARAVQSAYDLLSDPDRRDAYDAARGGQTAAGVPPASAPASAPVIAGAAAVAAGSVRATSASQSRADRTGAAGEAPLTMNSTRTAANPAPGALPGRRRSMTPLLIAAIVLIAVAVLAIAALQQGRHRKSAEAAAASASGTGLEVQTGKVAASPVTAARAMPCYVGGQLIGELPLGACAARNGVASGPMSVGLHAPAGAPPPAPVAAEPPATSDPIDAPVRSPPPAPAARDAAQQGRDTDAVIGDRAPAWRRPSAAARNDAASQAASSPDVNRTMAVVRAFYEALGDANGPRAASLVTPSKRAAGPLSARQIDRFYGTLAQPLQLTSVRALGPHTAEVRYRFVTAEGAACSGGALVSTTRGGGGRVLIGGIRAEGRC